MANNENLIPVRTENEARAKGRAGGIKSGEARRRKRDIRFAIAAIMESDFNGTTGAERVAAALFRQACNGDIKAIAKIEAWTLAANSIEAGEDITFFMP